MVNGTIDPVCATHSLFLGFSSVLLNSTRIRSSCRCGVIFLL
uniref:Uncharacterized protein n=1 Tax=Arundo donax TaxID=35708 RepID=A0A0A8ZIT1_ARUDO